VIALVAAVAVVLTCVAAVLVLRANGWRGTSRHLVLGAGDSITVKSGLTFTVPPGWIGDYSEYFEFPDWIPLGEAENGLHRSDYLAVWNTDRTAGDYPLLAVTFYGGGMSLPSGSRVVAQNAAATVYDTGSSEGMTSFRVVTRLPGQREGSFVTSVPDVAALESLKGFWNRLGARGITLP
jgi:hypothetical protein